MFENLNESQKAKALQYIQEIRDNFEMFMSHRLTESLVRIESQDQIDEMAYLKALEMIKERVE